MAIEIEHFICREDNYAVLMHDPESGETAAVDAPDGSALASALDERGWRLTHILCTHHHADHTDGNAMLKERYGARLIAPAAESGRIAGVDVALGDGEAVDVCGTCVTAIATPGHTSGHISYHLPEVGIAFTADCLFSLGCGRVFEGTMEEMHASLQRLAALPGETIIYCGHEYTASNARFALRVDPDNAALRQRAAEVDRLRGEGRMTLPTTLASELETNPFLRVGNEAIRRLLGMTDEPDAAVFAALRRLKDQG